MTGSGRAKAAGRRVLGVDTSLRSTGAGVVEAHGNRFSGLAHRCIRNPASRRHTACLHHLYSGIADLIEQYAPSEVAVEGIFYCKNVRTAVVLGQARGAVLAACEAAGVPVFEYSPRRVKQAVVGVGSAHKQQVAHMVTRLLGIQGDLSEDESDALALALCHLQQHSSLRDPETGRI